MVPCLLHGCASSAWFHDHREPNQATTGYGMGAAHDKAPSSCTDRLSPGIASSCLCGIIAPMHEMSVSQSILDIALRHAAQAGAGRIVAIDLVIGDLTGFVDESIQFYMDFLSKETLAQGAQLRFERIAPRVLCRACGTEYAPSDSRLWACPECEALGGEILAGKEFYVASIEIE